MSSFDQVSHLFGFYEKKLIKNFFHRHFGRQFDEIRFFRRQKKFVRILGATVGLFSSMEAKEGRAVVTECTQLVLIVSGLSRFA